MKKFVSGLLIGFLLAVPAFAFAEHVSMVGKKVQTEYPVIVDGKELEVKAVAIDGTSYAPLRVIGEAVGYDVDFRNKTVIFRSQSGESESGHYREEGEQVEPQAPTQTPPVQEPGPEFYYTLENIDTAIEGKQIDINALEMSINMALSSGWSEDKIEDLRKKKQEAEQFLERLKKFKEQLQAQQQK